jgi:hypothetical protein
MLQFLWVVLLWLLLRYSLMFIKFSVMSIHQYILEAGMHYLRLMTFRYRDCRDGGVLSNQPVPRRSTICKIRPPILHINIMWSILPVSCTYCVVFLFWFCLSSSCVCIPSVATVSILFVLFVFVLCLYTKCCHYIYIICFVCLRPVSVYSVLPLYLYYYKQNK